MKIEVKYSRYSLLSTALDSSSSSRDDGVYMSDDSVRVARAAIDLEMAVTASVDWRRLRTVVSHVVVWLTSCIVRFVVVLCSTSAGRPSSFLVSALPVDELPRLYLATGLTGRLSCPYDEDPPDRLVVWTKDGRPLESWNGQSRVRLGRGGVLVFAAASTPDEGVYTCLIYSPLHKGPESPPVQVLVRGKFITIIISYRSP